MFDSLRARLERLFAESGGGAGARASKLREAIIEAKVGVTTMRDAITATERELATERTELATAERRGRLAAQVPDAETVAVAERFAARHRERVLLLERRLALQRDELALAEREVREMAAQFRAARTGLGTHAASIDAAWRDLQAAGGTRPGTSDPEDELLRHQADRLAHEAAVEAQLAELKRKAREGKR